MGALTTTATGFVISEPELAFSPKGTAYVRLALAFGTPKKNMDGSWAKEKANAIVTNATAFGDLAEFIAEKVQKLTEVEVSGIVYEDTWEKDGETKKSIKMTVRTCSASLPKKGGDKPHRDQSAASMDGGWGSI